MTLHRVLGLDLDLALVVGLATLASGCAGSVHVSGGFAQSENQSRATCASPSSSFRVSTLDWDRESRRRFESDAKRRVIVVRAEQCGWSVLPRCEAKTSYAYRPLPLARDRREAGNTSGVGLSSSAGSSPNPARPAGGLRDIAVVGAFEVPEIPSPLELEGECDGATHIVAGYSTGAFQLDDARSRGASLDLPYAGHAQRSDWENQSISDGRVDACLTTSSNEPAPPVDCSAAIDIRFAPLARPAPAPVHAVAQNPAPQSPSSSCADANLTACDASCRAGVPESCAAIVRACAAGSVGACVSASTASLSQWLLAGR